MRHIHYFLLLCLAACSLPVTTASLAGTPQLTVQSSFTIPPDLFHGLRISQLSGLAWDEDEQLLYAVSDKGRIFHFRLRLDGNTITAVEPVFGARLTDVDGVRMRYSDAEGLMVLNANNGKHGDTELVVSLEGIPRLLRFTPQGRTIANIRLPPPLDKGRNYQNSNRELESVTYLPRYGFITAPELPLRGHPQNVHTIYSTQGQHWSFPAYPAENSGISALEALPDGNLLVLERAWSGIPNPLVVSLRYLDLAGCSRQGVCHADDLAVFSNHFLLDNFEGLTAIGHGRYLMVSDDNDEPFLRTNLTLFTLE